MLKYIISLFIFLFILIFKPAFAETRPTLWNYQCIDTMKTSRDNARRWARDPELPLYIEKELSAIVEIGGNCVALDTPYNDEFLPYLRLWVKTARKKNLKIWYRGNFSEWEGWFSYPKSMSEDELISRSNEFIRTNKDLFKDGDVYTAAPEAENGGPFNQVEIDEYEAYRAFLIRIHDEAKKTFADIGKKVVVNWLSMNGGLARRMFDKPTVDALDHVVTIDHYIKTAAEMGIYIKYFHETFKAKVVIGEFGAPVPDINGTMTEDSQADFIESLMKEMYTYKDSVEGVNYWVTYDSSTAILNDDYSPKKAAFVLKKYFKPGTVQGVVRDTQGNMLSNVKVLAGDGVGKTVTDRHGAYRLVLPESTMTMTYRLKGYGEQSTIISIKSGEKNIRDAHLTSTKRNISIWEKIRRYIVQ